MNNNFKDIGLTRLGIKPKSTAPEADALTTRPSELLKINNAMMERESLRLNQHLLEMCVKFDQFPPVA